MKKRYLIIVLFGLFLLVGCGNKTTGDKALYGEVKNALMTKIDGYDTEKKKEVKEDYGLDKKSLDELPLAIYNINGRYVGVIELSSDDTEYFYYSVKKKKIITKLDENIVPIDFGSLTPVYSQNGFN
ncbi:hypothetical protein [Vagococcus bubulae]|uniref:Uncharacterized protein n=1 Tax=Vagococcus bubulae TaxID=1977868 RepID=A0A429ZID5_9ENTE|nr:hypothetical protein [Vagococcus bubulae]RST93473.1 hypothetical protein CBF36_07570 [Vagococcus bubulae]